MPLFAGVIVFLLFFFRVMQVETGVKEALNYAGRYTAVEGKFVSSDAGELAIAEGLFRKELASCSQVEDYVFGGNMGVSLLTSDFSEDYVILSASYRVTLPIDFFQVKGISIVQRSTHRKWIGDTETEDDTDPYVYYTDTGTVYHLSKSCPYLDLSIKEVDLATVSSMRNKSDHKYSKCSKCAGSLKTGAVVYITDYGVLYHGSLTCSRLKRTIHTVHLSEVGNRGLCSKCKKNK